MEPFESLQYCTRCCIPETKEQESFDELGICSGCRSSEDKMSINWLKRREKLREIFDKVKSESGTNYDCILPISGGKDSFFQAHILTKVFGVKPLAVTFSANYYAKDFIDRAIENYYAVTGNITDLMSSFEEETSYIFE